MRFNGICIISSDVRRLAEFYILALGVEGEVNSTFVGLATKGATLSIFSEEGMETMAPGSMQGAGRGGHTVEFEVADVDQQYDRLQAMQVPIVKRSHHPAVGSPVRVVSGSGREHRQLLCEHGSGMLRKPCGKAT